MKKKVNPKNKEWIQPTFRMRSEAINLYKYLEYDAVIVHKIPKNIFFDKIVNWSLDYIQENNPKYNYIETDIKREVKGFTISGKTFDRLLEYFEQSKAKDIKKGVVLEILIGLYAINHLKEEELKNQNIYMNLIYI